MTRWFLLHSKVSTAIDKEVSTKQPKQQQRKNIWRIITEWEWKKLFSGECFWDTVNKTRVFENVLDHCKEETNNVLLE